MNTELTREEELQVAKLTGSIMGTALMGAARILKGTGWTIKKATGLTASGIYCVGGIVETSGSFAAAKCYGGAEYCRGKAAGYKFPVKNVSRGRIPAMPEDDFCMVCC